MSATPTPRTEEVLRKNAASEQTPQEDYEALAVHAEMLERELDFSEKTGRQIWQANERLQRELSAERALADRLAGALSVYWVDSRHLGHFMPEPANRKAEDALAAWKEARREA